MSDKKLKDILEECLLEEKIEMPNKIITPEIVDVKDAKITSTLTVDQYNNPALVTDIQKIFIDTTRDLIKNSKIDRAEVNDTVITIKTKIDNDPRSTANMYMALVEAHSVKANINTNMIKVLDALSKFTSASKSGQIQKKTTLESDELSKLLDGNIDD